jgi:hypothetical protein
MSQACYQLPPLRQPPRSIGSSCLFQFGFESCNIRLTDIFDRIIQLTKLVFGYLQGSLSKF